MVERILVPVDFSQPSLQALDYAIDFGRPHKAEIAVLHVVEPVYFAAPDGYGVGYDAGILAGELERAGKQQLARLAANLRARRVSVRTLQCLGTPHQTIIDVARKLKTDLVIMSTHGRSGLAHVLMGSVAERVVRSAPCPVLVVRPAPATRRRKTRAGAKRGKTGRLTGRRRAAPAPGAR
jgi:nucleotide-binding universal stress UspA family protein